MPELPEVETIRRGLETRVVGKSILEIVIGDSRVLKTDPLHFNRSLAGETIRILKRRGKNLLFQMDRHVCLVHLGMTGQLTFRDPLREDAQRFIRHQVTGLQRVRQHAPDRHTHLQFLFVDGSAMLYRDIRKFGKIILYPIHSEDLAAYLSRLGPEPLAPEFRSRSFEEGLRRRKTRIKAALLDQRLVAGVGNIYADEALFEARIHPEKRACDLPRAQSRRLFRAIRQVLEKGIRFGGSSLRDYVDSDGREGSNQEELLAYGREGLPCARCGSSILKVVVAQRGTHFCPKCQKAPKTGSQRSREEPTPP